MHIRTLVFLSLALAAFACNPPAPQTPPTMATPAFDLQGHRGWRGKFPENTIPGFEQALRLGVTTLELDVVISKDQQVVLSHEPWLSHEHCLSPDGKEIAAADERSFNLYQMTYAEIAACDCGTKPHPRFPQQLKIKVSKPLLADVIDAAEKYAAERNLPKPYYNIETKCSPEGDNQFHPQPEPFFDLVWDVISKKGVADRVILQSFDVRTLQVAHRKTPDLNLALLVENTDGPQANLDRLGFTPDIYSPEWVLIDDTLRALVKEKGMRLIPWTVNEPDDIRKVLDMGVDGIISDYPERVIALRNPVTFASKSIDMNVHHVFFWLKPGVDKAAFRKALEKLGEIYLVKQIHVGVPVPSERAVVDGSYDFSLLMFFENAADEEAYQNDADHHAFIDQWKDSWVTVKVYDASPDGK